MLEIVLTSSESDQYSSASKDISKFPLMYMTGYFCRSVYIDLSAFLYLFSCLSTRLVIDVNHIQIKTSTFVRKLKP